MRKGFWRLKQQTRDHVLLFLRTGMQPNKLIISLVLGVLIGLMPLLGLTTLIGFLIASFFKLNMVLLQLANYLVFPLQLILLGPFFQLGDLLFNSGATSFSFVNLAQVYAQEGFMNFFRILGEANVYAVLTWLIVALPLGIMMFFVFRLISQNIKTCQYAAF